MFVNKIYRWELLILFLILIVGGVLRLYRIDEYMTFLGDEGRDARVVRRLIVDFDPVLIGPMTSVTTSAGHMYLGPLYYYLMSPAMILSNLLPVGPAVMVALFSLATIVMMWWLGRSWWHPIAGLTAAALYAVSPTVIVYSRSSWNPNVMPFFALLTIWAVWEIGKGSGPHPALSHKERDAFSFQEKVRMRSHWWFVVLGVSMAFVLQSHYLGLLILPVVGIFWLIGLRPIINNRYFLKHYLLSSVFCLLSFFLLMSPLLLFDMRHEWLNTRALMAFFTERQTTVNLKFYKGFENILPLMDQIYGSLLTVTNEMWGRAVWVSTCLLIIAGALLKRIINVHPNTGNQTHPTLSFSKERASPSYFKRGLGGVNIGQDTAPLLLILVWWIVGILGLSVYKQHIYDHYFGFLWPVPFLLTGWMVVNVGRVGYVGKLIGGLIVGFLVYYNLSNSPLLAVPNRQLQKTEEVARKIVEASGERPFNLAMIAKSNYDESYRYFLEWWKTPLVEIEPQRASETITEQLFVICENSPPYANRDEDCNPISHPKAEIALFGWAKVEQEWELPWGYRLYKLVHVSLL